MVSARCTLGSIYGRLLASFQDDAKYEHVGQDTRSQGGKDDQDKQGKDLKISDIKTKSKDNDKGSRSKITKHEGTSLQRIQRPRPQDLNDKSNLIDLMKECHNELTSGEIVTDKKPDNVKVKNPTGVRPKGHEKKKRIKSGREISMKKIVFPGGSDHVDVGIRDGASGSVSV
ncbi:hypothetical protein Tco_0900418 [Tanacetum coccineum]